MNSKATAALTHTCCLLLGLGVGCTQHRPQPAAQAPEDGQSRSQFVGAWTTGRGMFMAVRRFAQDGSYEERVGGQLAGTGDWHYRDGRLYWSSGGEAHIAEVHSVRGDQLVFKVMGPPAEPTSNPGNIIVLRRVG